MRMECMLVSAAGVWIQEVLNEDALLITTQVYVSFPKQHAHVMNTLETSKCENTIT